jgi:hypothetical protein
MWTRRAGWALATALLATACGSGTGARGSSGPEAAARAADDPEAAWMDTAEVRVTEDICAGTSTVELIDVASGHQALVDSESFPPEACTRT